MLKKKRTTASGKLVLVKSVRRTRSHRMKFCVQSGLGCLVYTSTALELAPEGTGYRARTRFSKFFNLPELMNLFKEVADIKTADQLNLPTPEVEYHNIVAQPTEHPQELVKALSERASLGHSGTVDPSQDNMLKITSCLLYTSRCV